jgi:hypothetical protein
MSASRYVVVVSCHLWPSLNLRGASAFSRSPTRRYLLFNPKSALRNRMIRRQLQVLRDLGLLIHLRNGVWKLSYNSFTSEIFVAMIRLKSICFVSSLLGC